MRKFKVSLVDADNAVKEVEQGADGFIYDPDRGFFSQRGTATFYVRKEAINTVYTHSITDNIAVYRGVTEVVEVKPVE